MRKIIIALSLLSLLCVRVYAQQNGGIDTDSLREGLNGRAEELLGEYDPAVQTDLTEGVLEILSDAIEQSGSAVRSSLRTMLQILVILALCRVVSSMGTEHSAKTASVTAALGITACCISDVHTLMGVSLSVMDDITVFSGLLLPVMAAAAASAGAPVSASAIHAIAVFFSNLLINACRYVLVPLVYAYLALAMADDLLMQDRLQKLKEFLGWLIKLCLKAVVYGFTGFLAATGLISGSTDAAALKAVKAAISTMVPVVGGIISGAADTVLSGARLIKSAVGTFGLLAVLAYFTVPFFQAGISYLMFKLTSALGGLVDQGHGKLLDAITTSLGFMLAMIGTTALMSMLSCCFFLKAVSA